MYRFNDDLLALNHSRRRVFISWQDKNKFVSSANIISSKTFET